MKKRLFIVVLIIICAILLLQIDDELSPDAEAMLNSVTWSERTEANIYLAGFGVENGKEPAKEGKQVLSDLKNWEQKLLQTNSQEVEPFYFPRELAYPNHDGCCFYNEANTLVKAIVDDQKYDSAEVSMQVLRQRYLNFIQLEGYTGISAPHFMTAFPNWNYLVYGNRIALYELIQLAEHSPQLAVDQIYTLVEQQKKFIAKADNLVTRMISYVLINDSINVLSLLIQKHEASATFIKPLTQDQLSLASVMNFELGHGVNGMSHWVNDGKTLIGLNFRVPNWLGNLLIKRNMMANLTAQQFKEVVSLSNIEQSQFEKKLSDLNLGVRINKLAWLRNPLGSKLVSNNEHATTSFKKYIARGFDINAKISLFNAILGQSVKPSLIERIENPYYSSAGHMSIDSKSKTVCFNGPFEDKRNYRCLTFF